MQREQIRKPRSLRRHGSLAPLAKDHGVELVWAQGLQKAITALPNERIRMAEELREACRDLIIPYLQDERHILSPIIPFKLLKEFNRRQIEVQQTINEFMRVEPSREPTIGLLSRTYLALDEYIRWQERVLFPILERTLNAAALWRLSAKTSWLDFDRARPTQVLHSSTNHAAAEWMPNSSRYRAA